MPSEGMIWLKICLLKDGFCLKEILALGWLFQLVKTVFLNKKNAFNSQAYHSIDFVFVIMTNWKWSLLLFCFGCNLSSNFMAWKFQILFHHYFRKTKRVLPKCKICKQIQEVSPGPKPVWQSSFPRTKARGLFSPFFAQIWLILYRRI